MPCEEGSLNAGPRGPLPRENCWAEAWLDPSTQGWEPSDCRTLQEV